MPSTARPRVLLSATARYPFVEADIALLRSHFDLDVYIGSGVRGVWQNLLRAMRADVSFCWLGSVYTFFMTLGARLGGKRSMVMLGGVDVAREPEINYGLWLTPWKGRLLGAALRRADRVFVVDMSMREQLEQSSGERWEKIEWLPTGYDLDYWTPNFPKTRRVLTVAACNAGKRPEVKGIDLLIEVAHRLPDVPFRLIGPSPDLLPELRALAPPNMEILSPIPHTQLLEEYRAAQVYCQPSRREGLPNALCEAMLCGCVPVGTHVNGIPTAIGQSGYVVQPDDADTLQDAIAEALAAPESAGLAAREQIASTFPMERRENTLVHTILQLSRAQAHR